MSHDQTDAVYVGEICNTRTALTRWCGQPINHKEQCDGTLTGSWPFHGRRQARPQTVRVPECPFCDIAAFEAPANIVRAWPDALAIVPLNPHVDGHVLVIPRTHVAHYAHDPEVSALTMRRAAEFARDYDWESSNQLTSAGVAATQSVNHLHLHLLPRRFDDRVQLPWHSGKHTRRPADSTATA